jgi:hypothetical protein
MGLESTAGKAFDQGKKVVKDVLVNAPKEAYQSGKGPVDIAAKTGANMLTKAIGGTVESASKTTQFVLKKVAGFLGRNALEVAKIPPNLLLALPIIPIPAGKDGKDASVRDLMTKGDPRNINAALSRPGGLDELAAGFGKKPEEKKPEDKTPEEKPPVT